MSLKERQVDAMWEKLGFAIDKTAKDVRARLWIGGQLAAWSYRSHGRGKLSGTIPHKIRTQMHLNEEEFRDALACPLDKADYIAILRDKGYLPRT